MEWVKDFYPKQREWLSSAGYWVTLSISDLPEKAGRQAALVDRLAPGNGKRVLELGCGGGMDAAAIALAGHTVVAVDIVDACVSSARRLADHFSKGKLKVIKGNFYEIETSGRFICVPSLKVLSLP